MSFASLLIISKFSTHTSPLPSSRWCPLIISFWSHRMQLFICMTYTSVLPEDSPGSARGGSGRCFHASTFPLLERNSSSCVASLRLLGRRAPARGMPMLRGSTCPSFARSLTRSCAACRRASRHLPNTAGTGHTRGWDLLDRDGPPEMPSTGHAAPARCRTGTDANAARVAWGRTRHSHDTIGTVSWRV